MISQQTIDETVIWNGLKDFGRYVLSFCENGSLPDYAKMSLMDLPGIVSNVLVHDLREKAGREKLLVNFSGTKIDEIWGRNIMGEYDLDYLKGDPSMDQMVKHRLTCIDTRRPGYSMRVIEVTRPHGDKSYRHGETLYFPCSSDESTVNWGIGCVSYDLKPFDGENVFLHF